MATRRTIIAWSFLILIAAGCPRRASPPPQPFEDWYPADISLPAGVTYPCAVTALPSDLVGIPGKDHRYLNHVYAVIIGLVREKQTLLHAVSRRGDASQAHAAYVATSDDALTRLQAEPVPSGLVTFHEDVIAAIKLHRTHFERLMVARQNTREGPVDLSHITEGRQASQHLGAAWSAMEGRYDEWSPEVKDSIYHHLCALDLY